MNNEADRVTSDEVATSVETDETRVKRFDKRIEEWLTSLRDEASERSPEVLGAMAAKVKDVGDYLEKMAEQARTKRTPHESSGDEYAGPDPEANTKGDGSDEDQGT